MDDVVHEVMCEQLAGSERADAGFGSGSSGSVPASCPGKTPALYNGGQIDRMDNRGALFPHYIRVTFPYYKSSDVKDFCDEWFGESEENKRPLFYYQKSIKYSNGVTFNWDRGRDESLRRHCGLDCLDVSGSILDSMTIEECEMFCAGVLGLEGKGTRVDAAFDDYEKSISPQEVGKKALSGEVVKFRTLTPKVKYKMTKSGPILTHDEFSFGCRGSKGSGKYLRIYDKFVESDKSIDAYRWEVELTGEHAETALKKLGSCNGDLGKFLSIIGGLITGVVDFKDPRNGETHLGRRERSNWWEEMQEKIGAAILLRKTQVKVSIDKLEKYMKSQVGPSLAVLLRAKGADYFHEYMNDLMNDGLNRQRLKHNRLVSEYHALCEMEIALQPGPGESASVCSRDG